jgi:hypothetical protein
MAGATPIYALPYQGVNDSPNGPLLGQALAEAVETLLAGPYATTRNDAASALITAMLASLLSTKAAVSSVATNEGTTSATYVDLATPGPQVSITSVGTRAIAFWKLVQGSSAGTAVTALNISGATTSAPADAAGLIVNDGNRTSVCFSVHTINPGLNNYKLQYRVTGGTGVFADRSLFVLAP